MLEINDLFKAAVHLKDKLTRFKLDSEFYPHPETYYFQTLLCFRPCDGRYWARDVTYAALGYSSGLIHGSWQQRFHDMTHIITHIAHPHTYMQDAMCEGSPAGRAICSPATGLWVSRADKVPGSRDLHKLCAKGGERRSLAAASLLNKLSARVHHRESPH